MKNRSLNLILIFSMCGSVCLAETSRSASAATASPTVRSTSLDEALTSVLEGAPSLRSQRDLMNLAKRDRSTRWLPREPSFSFAQNDDSASAQYSLSLAVPFPAKVFEAGRADDVRVENAEREFRARAQDLVRSITQSYVQCAAAQESLRLIIKSQEDLTSSSNFITRQYEGGLSSQSEKIGIELQLAQSRADLESAKIAADADCRRYTQLTASLLEAPLAVPNEVPSQVSAEILAKVGTTSAETLRAEQSIGEARILERNAFWSAAPDIAFSVTRNHYLTTLAAPLPTEWSTSYMVSISIPIFFLWNERTDVQRAKAVARQTSESAKVAQTQSTVDQAEACNRWRRASSRQGELEKRDLPMAEAWVESTEAAYRRGKVGFAELLLARKTVFDLRNQLVQAKSNSVLNLVRSLGSSCS